MNKSDVVEMLAPKTVAGVSNMRWMTMALAAYCVTNLIDAQAVPITISDSESGAHSVWSNSASTNRYSDFVIQDSRSSIVQFAKFDSSLGTLLSAELTLNSTASHPSRTVFLPEVSGLPIELPLGAIAQDTERELHGPLNLWAYYDARVSYRADYRLTVDPLNSNLFTLVAAEAAFGSCAQSEDLIFDIGNTNPYCTAGNNGSPLADFNYTWGPLSGADLAQFIGNDLLQFDTRMTGDAYGHCDDDVGDYCRVNLAMNWNWDLSLSYTYEPGVPDTGGENGGGGDPVPVSEPGTVGMLSLALFGLVARRRRRAA
jgi:hypothetical protein